MTRRHSQRIKGPVSDEKHILVTMVKEDNEIKTMSVPTAGRLYFDIGRNASYEAARRGDIPVIRIGSRLRVPVVALEQMLRQAGQR